MALFRGNKGCLLDFLLICIWCVKHFLWQKTQNTEWVDLYGCLVGVLSIGRQTWPLTPHTTYCRGKFLDLVCSAWVLGTLYRSTNVTLFLNFSVLFLFVQPISLCWLKNSIKGSEIEANNWSILFYQFNCKAIESVIQSPVALPAPSFLERFHTCSVRNCESAFSNPNFQKVAENICQAAHMFLVPWEEENTFSGKKWKL